MLSWFGCTLYVWDRELEIWLFPLVLLWVHEFLCFSLLSFFSAKVSMCTMRMYVSECVICSCVFCPVLLCSFFTVNTCSLFSLQRDSGPSQYLLPWFHQLMSLSDSTHTQTGEHRHNHIYTWMSVDKDNSHYILHFKIRHFKIIVIMSTPLNDLEILLSGGKQITGTVSVSKYRVCVVYHQLHQTKTPVHSGSN